MLCASCPKRPECRKPCPRLEAHLKKLEVSQKEALFSPEKLARIAEHRLFSWPELAAPHDDPRPATRETPPLHLPHELLLPFTLRFLEGWPPEKIARRLKVHPATVRRRIRRAALLLEQRRRESLELVETGGRSDGPGS